MNDFYKDKKVLVAGGAGFVGSNVIEGLLERGAKVRATIHSHPPRIRDDQVEFVNADLQTPEGCQRAVEGVDYVFMCAASTSGSAVIEHNPLAHVTPNVIMNALMLEAAYRAGVKKFLFMSSNTVYPMTDYPVKEDEMMAGEPFEKYFCVAWMKRFGEIMCQMYGAKIKNPMKTVVVRPANLYGEYDHFDLETSHVIPALIRKCVERHKPFEVWGDGKDLKEFIYVKDFVKGVLLAMERLENFDPVNIATGRPVTVNDLLRTILEVDGYTDAEIVHNTSKPTMIPKRLIDTTKAKKLLGFEATTTLEEGLRNTINWYRMHMKKT